MDIILSYDADKLYNVYGTTVSFELQSTVELDTMVDEIRHRKGYIPFFDYTGSDVWTNGWYDFYLYVDILKRKVIGLEAIVQGNNADKEICPDNKSRYLLDDIGNDVLEQLNRQLRNRYHTSLDEIEKEVKEYEL